MPGQLGPINLLLLFNKACLTLIISKTGIPSVIQTTKSKFASKRPIEREKEPFDIEPLEDTSFMDVNKKIEKLEIDDPW